MSEAPDERLEGALQAVAAVFGQSSSVANTAVTCPAWCPMSGILAACLSVERDALCMPCTEHELGETWPHLRTRTARGWPKGKYHRWLVDQFVVIDKRDRARVRKLAGMDR